MNINKMTGDSKTVGRRAARRFISWVGHLRITQYGVNFLFKYFKANLFPVKHVRGHQLLTNVPDTILVSPKCPTSLGFHLNFILKRNKIILIYLKT